jgi:hypothetical protein
MEVQQFCPKNSDFRAFSRIGATVPNWNSPPEVYGAQPNPCVGLCAWAVNEVGETVAKQNGKTRKVGAASTRAVEREADGAGRVEQVPTDLHMASRSSLSDLAPGDIVFLDDFAHLREAFAPIFVAVLACPACGSPGLITRGQYFSGVPIVCTSRVCAGLFRIIGEVQIVPLRPI